MNYINLLSEKQYIIYRDVYKERIKYIKSRIAFEKRLVNGVAKTIEKYQLEIKIIRMHIRHMDEKQKFARILYPKQAKNEKA